MKNNNIDENDILSSIDIQNKETNEDFVELLMDEKETKNYGKEIIDPIVNIENETDDNLETYIKENNEKPEKIFETKSKYKSIINNLSFIFKYVITSVFIFGFLLLTTNYSAYISIAKNYLYKDEIVKTQKSLINSVNASVIKEKIQAKEKMKKIYKNQKDIEKQKEEYKIDMYSMKQLMNKANREDINIDIDISPYENRIVIPKIGKNVPLIDIKRKIVSGKNELNEIFMDELKNGVIRYPGSVKPGELGNTFIFGHSSNFPWVPGKYNEVFALLDKVKFGDEVIVYYGQEKYTYKIREKKVIRPGNVGVLKNKKTKKEITIMTCWPVGTTLNRLIVVGDLIEKK
ncbi:hypothetical protein CSA08_01625 [Candidatus Gracilibacteria bacterium]|nr:MAG: hypothetical protein CSA08_01625 [Candidatus Gracilibacteria bacterium]